MLEDNAKYTELQLMKDTEKRAFHEKKNEVILKHQTMVATRAKEHQDNIETQKDQINKLKNEIATKQRDNNETMKQIEEDAEQEIDEIKQKHNQNYHNVSDMGLQSKAALQMMKKKIKDA